MAYLADIAFLSLLMALNGFFAMAELALISCSKPRLNVLIQEGHYGARAASKLAENPGRFLSTVQVGITLVGIFSGVYGGERLAPPLEAYFEGIEYLAPFAEEAAIFSVVGGITYFSILIGELVPKQLALRNPERVASAVAPVMGIFAKLMLPFVYVLDHSAKALLWLGGAGRPRDQSPTEEEIRAVLAEGVNAGVLEQAEREIIGGVMRVADWRAKAIMTPRLKIDWLDLEKPREDILRQVRMSRYSRLPVAAGSLDDLQGVVQAKDMLNVLLDGSPLEMGRVMSEPLYVLARTPALRVVDSLKQSAIPMAIVLDEHGDVEGLLTKTDVLAALVGELCESGLSDEPAMTSREDGSWLVDGELPVHVLKDRLALGEFPGKGDFETCAGFCLSCFEKVPAAGEYFDWEGLRFEVVDMDGNRIDKILVTRH